MKQSLGVALQIRTLERIEKKLDIILRAGMGEEAGQKLIDELAQPVNPARTKVEAETQPAQAEVAEAEQAEEPKTETRKQAEELKAGRKGK